MILIRIAQTTENSKMIVVYQFVEKSCERNFILDNFWRKEIKDMNISVKSFYPEGWW